MNPAEEDRPAPHFPQNRQSSPSKLLKGGKHCPVCLAPKAKIAPRTRLRKDCLRCGAQPLMSKQCPACLKPGIYVNRMDAACPYCGAHGRRCEMLA